MRIDGHAHACGEYLTVEQIKRKLEDAKMDQVLLTPGQYGSKMTYSLQNLARKRPYADVVSKNNRTTSLMQLSFTSVGRSLILKILSLQKQQNGRAGTVFLFLSM